MSAFKKQHYLPSAYLKSFSVDGRRGSRKSKIWRIDVKGRREVSVESQGYSDYHYSMNEAAQVEKEFKVGEDFYAACYPDIWDHAAPTTPRKVFGLFVMMLDLHIRNMAYAKEVRDNHADYCSISATVKYRILWGRKAAPPNDRALVAEARRNWRVSFVRCAAGNNFLTSDNPSLLVKVGLGRAFANMVLLPVTPFTYAVGYDSRALEVTPGQLSARDESVLNQMQVRNCLTCIYTRANITDFEWEGFKQQITKPGLRRVVEGPGIWGADLFMMPTKNGLGFVRRRRLRRDL